jgi:hypothetical protein
METRNARVEERRAMRVRAASQVWSPEDRSRLRPGLDDIEVPTIHCNQG